MSLTPIFSRFCRRIPANMMIPVIQGRGVLAFLLVRTKMKLAKRNVMRPICDFSMTIFTALVWHLCGVNVPRMRLLSSPNSADELLESPNLGAAELFPELIFGFLPSVTRRIVKQRKLKLFHDLSSREFRACGSLS